MNRDPVVDARAVVAELFPHARWALLAGSVATADRTAGSDLDIVVLLPDGDPQAPHRDSRLFRQWPVELFVHDSQTLDYYRCRDVPERRPALHRMVAMGIPLVGDPAEWQAASAAVLAAGPAPLTDPERESQRYTMTDRIDDLTHARDPGERTVIAAAIWAAVAELALLDARHWIGRGKWLLRELRDHDTALADRWLRAHGDAAAIESLARVVLDTAGGPLFAGYHVPGERPAGLV